MQEIRCPHQVVGVAAKVAVPSVYAVTSDFGTSLNVIACKRARDFLVLEARKHCFAVEKNLVGRSLMRCAVQPLTFDLAKSSKSSILGY